MREGITTLTGGVTDEQMLTESVLDYEQLVARYQADLFALLRGHRSLDYLEIWVPDEDHVKSLLNMVEAAQSCGCDRLTVDIGPATQRELDAPRLLDVLAEVGTATLAPVNDALRLTVTGLNEPRIGTAYARKLRELARTPVHTGTAAAPAGGTPITATCDGVTLAARVDADGIVSEAAHDGAAGDMHAALDVMCAIMRGRPLQEAADHGVIRLESELRDRRTAAPLPGIMNPLAADPIFAGIQTIVRELNARLIATRNVRATRNTFADPPGRAWQGLSPEARRTAVESAIHAALVDHGQRADDARVLAIEHDDRVMLAFRSELPAALKARLALALEVELHARCDATLQIFLTEVKDENAARRL